MSDSYVSVIVIGPGLEDETQLQLPAGAIPRIGEGVTIRTVNGYGQTGVARSIHWEIAANISRAVVTIDLAPAQKDAERWDGGA